MINPFATVFGHSRLQAPKSCRKLDGSVESEMPWAFSSRRDPQPTGNHGKSMVLSRKSMKYEVEILPWTTAMMFFFGDFTIHKKHPAILRYPHLWNPPDLHALIGMNNGRPWDITKQTWTRHNGIELYQGNFQELFSWRYLVCAKSLWSH